MTDTLSELDNIHDLVSLEKGKYVQAIRDGEKFHLLETKSTVGPGR